MFSQKSFRPWMDRIFGMPRNPFWNNFENTTAQKKKEYQFTFKRQKKIKVSMKTGNGYQITIVESLHLLRRSFCQRFWMHEFSYNATAIRLPQRDRENQKRVLPIKKVESALNRCLLSLHVWSISFWNRFGFKWIHQFKFCVCPSTLNG